MNKYTAFPAGMVVGFVPGFDQVVNAQSGSAKIIIAKIGVMSTAIAFFIPLPPLLPWERFRVYL
ncbi:MAG: hypothetical protein AAB594_02310 [Patescibacteria group bacterium]